MHATSTTQHVLNVSRTLTLVKKDLTFVWMTFAYSAMRMHQIVLMRNSTSVKLICALSVTSLETALMMLEFALITYASNAPKTEIVTLDLVAVMTMLAKNSRKPSETVSTLKINS